MTRKELEQQVEAARQDWSMHNLYKQNTNPIYLTEQNIREEREAYANYVALENRLKLRVAA